MVTCNDLCMCAVSNGRWTHSGSENENLFVESDLFTDDFLVVII